MQTASASSPLFKQWLLANTIVPDTDEVALKGLARRAAEQSGHDPETLLELRDLCIHRTVSNAAQRELSAALAAKPTKTLEDAVTQDVAAAARLAKESAAARDAAARLAKEQRRLVEEKRKLVEEERRLEETRAEAAAEAERRAARAEAARAKAAADEEAARVVASREAARAEASREAARAEAKAATDARKDALWAAFWARETARLRGDLRETGDGYEVELLGDGAPGLELTAARGGLRVRGVLVPGADAKALLTSAVDERCGPDSRASVRANVLRRLGNGRYGQVDEVIRLPAAADLTRATKEARGGALLVSIPRKRLHQPRRSPYGYGRAMHREPSFPPHLAAGGPGFYW